MAGSSNMGSSNMEAARSGYYEELGRDNLAPLWTVLKALVTPQPTSPALPAAWSYDLMRRHLMRAGELITAEEAERRVIILENPGLPGRASITSTLYAGLQLILPGEIAPCHRHTQSALRFIMEGSGAYTAVNGEKAMMESFDLVLTPPWVWHDHGNDTDQPMIWLDGLDIPLIRALDASFAEHLNGRAQHPETLPPGDCQARYGSNLRPVRGGGSLGGSASPFFHYRYADWRPALESLAANEAPDPHDGYRMEFTNPVTGGSVMPTISAFCQKVPAGFATAAQRSTDGIIHVVVEGAGSINVNGEDFPLRPREVVVAPSWAKRRITAERDLILFSYSDKAAQTALNLWREERTDR